MDEHGRLQAKFTIEGMHIKPNGYRAIFEDVMKYVMDSLFICIDFLYICFCRFMADLIGPVGASFLHS